MKMLKIQPGAAGRLKLAILKKLDYLIDVLQCLVVITIIDELCCVKLTNKKDIVRSIIARKNERC